MSGEKLYRYEDAYPVARSVVAALEKSCQRIAIAGSVRREMGEVHDVDIVAWPICTQVQNMLFAGNELASRPVMLFALLNSLSWRHSGDWDKQEYPRIIKITWRPEAVHGIQIPIELYLCEPDGSNYEALVQMRTGDAEFNRSLAVRAKKMGLQYRAGHGIYRGEQRVDDGTEDGIFRALGLEPIPPELRIRDYHFCIRSPR